MLEAKSKFHFKIVSQVFIDVCDPEFLRHEKQGIVLKYNYQIKSVCLALVWLWRLETGHDFISPFSSQAQCDYDHLRASGHKPAEREGARQHEGVHQRHHKPAPGHRPSPALLLALPGPGHADLLGAGVRQPRVVGGGAALVLPLCLRLPALPWTATSSRSAKEWVIITAAFCSLSAGAAEFEGRPEQISEDLKTTRLCARLPTSQRDATREHSLTL